MTRTRLVFGFLGLAAILTTLPARAGDREFHEIVNRLATAYQKKPMPCMGFVSFIARVGVRFSGAHGVSDFKMAVFDNIGPSRGPDEREFDAFMQKVVGPEFHPFVRVRSHRDHEQTYIYLRDANTVTEMLLVTVDESDAVVMKMKLNPAAMMDWMDDPVSRGKTSAHNGPYGSSD